MSDLLLEAVKPLQKLDLHHLSDRQLSVIGLSPDLLSQQRPDLETKTPQEQMRHLLEHICIGGGHCTFLPPENIDIELVDRAKQHIQDLAKLDDEEKENWLLAIQICARYLQADIVKDEFEEVFPDHVVAHAERTKWRTRMKEIFGSIFTDVYENNRVRVNLLTSIYGITDELLRDHSVQDHAALRQLLQDIFALADIPKPSANESTISYINWTEK
jgi:hypothetical protein